MTHPAPGPSGRLRIIVLGYLVRGPLGGAAWHHLQYVLGLDRLGHDVYFVEDSGDEEGPSCYDPEGDGLVNFPTYGLAFAEAAFGRLGLAERWAYHDAKGAGWHGPVGPRAEALCRSADLVLNLSGVNPLRPWLVGAPARALVDTDPAFTQVRHLTEPDRLALACQHTSFHTFAGNIGQPGCTIPDDGLPWTPTCQPVVLSEWPVTPGPAEGPFTTIMQWDAYPAREHDGKRYGLKSDSFPPFLDLPRRSPGAFEMAVGGLGPAAGDLLASGWQVRDPRPPTRDPWTYQRFLQRSRAEFSVAKHGYTSTWSGWFSERSASYLASGRPVLVQDTGFSEWLGPWPGVLPFTTLEEALAGVHDLARDYRAHCRGARAAAEEHFDARAVLPRLLEEALAQAGTRRPVGVAMRPLRPRT